ncbi:MAG TPA: hypothetical protein VNL14_19605 [Candidatus Acidoferrales bacterium]|nr:hypothetical protein [Candidatus Acidoferrales bacterium]
MVDLDTINKTLVDIRDTLLSLQTEQSETNTLLRQLIALISEMSGNLTKR